MADRAAARRVNVESLQNLDRTCGAGLRPRSAVRAQLNKRDPPTAMAPTRCIAQLNIRANPPEAVAPWGVGVFETLKAAPPVLLELKEK